MAQDDHPGSKTGRDNDDIKGPQITGGLMLMRITLNSIGGNTHILGHPYLPTEVIKSVYARQKPTVLLLERNASGA